MTSLEITRLKQQLVCCNNEKAKLQREMDALRTRNETLTSDLYDCNNADVYGVILIANSEIPYSVDAMRDNLGNDVEVISNPDYAAAFSIGSVGDAILFKIKRTTTSLAIDINVPSSPGSSGFDSTAYSAIVDTANFSFGAGGGSGTINLNIDLSLGNLFITMGQ